MTFSGLKTAIKVQFHDTKNDRSIPVFEREWRQYSFEELLNLAASIQFAVCSQIERKLNMALSYCERTDLEINALNIVGSLAKNKYLQKRMKLMTS